jgi:anhydro-N-acetylmuramic acid kinase
VETWLEHEFFAAPPPKSTGRELFSPSYLQACLEQCDRHQLSSYDIMATLTELTARAIVSSYKQFLPQLPDEVLVCGGGSRNSYLMERLSSFACAPLLKFILAISMAWMRTFKEAIAFAVLGFLRLHNLPGNMPSVTGANAATFRSNRSTDRREFRLFGFLRLSERLRSGLYHINQFYANPSCDQVT